MRPVPLLAGVTAAIAITAGCGSSSSTGSNGSSNGVESKSGAGIVAAAVAATARQSSFHFVETANQAGGGVSIVADIGESSGEQHVTILNGGKIAHLTFLLAGGIAYFEGNPVGLAGFTGLSAKLSAKYAGKWISVTSANQSFSSIAGTLSVRTAALQLVKVPGTLTKGATSTQLGHRVVAVKAAESSSSGSLKLTMYVATTGAALPVLVAGTTTSNGGARSVSARFSEWGETVHVTAPSRAVPIATVQALAG